MFLSARNSRMGRFRRSQVSRRPVSVRRTIGRGYGFEAKQLDSLGDGNEVKRVVDRRSLRQGKQLELDNGLGSGVSEGQRSRPLVRERNSAVRRHLPTAKSPTDLLP
ncbi:MAG: hypothetical protein R3B96_25070 [Pirellulaceae bacterium]